MSGRIARAGLALVAAAMPGWAVAAGEGPASPAFAAVAGRWQGTVSELGLPRFEMVLTLRADGSGEAAYPDFPCRSRLFPVGEGLVLAETIAEGQDRCADGTVELTPAGDALRWLWRDATGAVRAVARLTPAE